MMADVIGEYAWGDGCGWVVKNVVSVFAWANTVSVCSENQADTVWRVEQIGNVGELTVFVLTVTHPWEANQKLLRVGGLENWSCQKMAVCVYGKEAWIE